MKAYSIVRGRKKALAIDPRTSADIRQIFCNYTVLLRNRGFRVFIRLNLKGIRACHRTFPVRDELVRFRKHHTVGEIPEREIYLIYAVDYRKYIGRLHAHGGINASARNPVDIVNRLAYESFKSAFNSPGILYLGTGHVGDPAIVVDRKERYRRLQAHIGPYAFWCNRVAGRLIQQVYLLRADFSGKK